jgi:hypothetical protein
VFYQCEKFKLEIPYIRGCTKWQNLTRFWGFENSHCSLIQGRLGAAARRARGINIYVEIWYIRNWRIYVSIKVEIYVDVYDIISLRHARNRLTADGSHERSLGYVNLISETEKWVLTLHAGNVWYYTIWFISSRKRKYGCVSAFLVISF